MQFDFWKYLFFNWNVILIYDNLLDINLCDINLFDINLWAIIH